MTLPFSIFLFHALVLFNFHSGRTDEVTELAVNEAAKYDPESKWSGYNSLWDQGPIFAHATSFLSLVTKSTIFIDKTLLLNDLLRSSNDAILITCPPRWGKSVNLDMIRKFVEIETDKDGNAIRFEEEKQNYQLFKRGRYGDTVKLRKPLLVSKHDDLFYKYQGRHPAILMRLYFHNITNATQYETALRDNMCELYAEYKYMLNAYESLMNSSMVPFKRKLEAEADYNKFQKYLDGKAPLEDLLAGLKYLSEALHKHYNEKVFLLLDDYDQLINDLLLKAAFHEKNPVRNLHLTFLRNSVTDNPYLIKVIATGLMSVAKYLSQGTLSKLVVYNFLNSPLTQYYGYTEREMNLIYSHLRTSPENRTFIDAWFRGYRAGLVSPVTIYDPRSVNMYLERKQVTYAWETKLGTLESVLSRFMSIDCFEEAWHVLITGGNYTIEIDSLDDAGKLNAYYGQYQSTPGPQAIDIVLHYLLIQGYLTWVHCQYPSPTKTTPITVRVPNNEVLTRLKTLTFVYYSSKRLNLGASKLIKETNELDELFIEFVESNATRGYLYELTLQEFLKLLPEFEDDPPEPTTTTTKDPTTNTTFKPIKEPFSKIPPSVKVQIANRNLVRSALYFTYMYNHNFQIYFTDRNTTDIKKPDIMLRRNRRGIVIKIVYIGRLSPFLMEDPKPFINTSYISKFNQDVDSVKFITMLVQNNKRVTGRAWEEDIKK